MEIQYLHRKYEMKLLLIAFLAIFIGFTVVEYYNNAMQPALAGAIAAGCCAIFVVVHGLLKRMGHSGDPIFLPVAGILVAIGLVFIFRLRPTLLIYQVAWLAAGGIGFLSITYLLRTPEMLRTYKYLFGVCGVLLILGTIMFGVNIGGSKSWIILGPIRFEPAEIAKILLVVFLAGYLEEKRRLLIASRWGTGRLTLPHPLHLGPMLVMWGFALALLVFEKDLGAALLYYGTFLVMLYIASSRFAYVGLGLILMVLGAWLSYHLFAHVQVRFDIWLNPWTDPDGRGYQIVQSLFAFGTGGIFGTGLSTGHPEYIPAVHTDFIFAAIGEELGLAGTLAVLTLYVILIYRGFRAAIYAHSEFSALLAAGLSSLLAWQVFVIVGGVIKFVPLTGVTLPFISYGGSSMLTNFLILGLLHNISENR